MIDKIKKNKENIFVYGAFIVYAILSLIGIVTHESWCDEAQAWLIARDLGIFDIVKQMRYEGHSCLWHLVLFPFAHLGFPYQTTKVISWLFCLVAVYLILKKAPFHKIIRILLIFNPAILYLYPAISRCYAMIPLFIVAIAILYKDRRDHPYLYATLIALLANTHVMMFPMAGMLFLTFWGEELRLRRKKLAVEEKKVLWKSCCIAMIGFLFLMLQVLPGVFESEIFHVAETTSKITGGKEIITKFQTAIQNMTNLFFQKTLINESFFYIAIELLIVASLYDKKHGLIFWIQTVFTIIINGFIFFMMNQRVFIFILYLLFFTWVYEPRFKKEENLLVKKLPQIAFALILIITLSNYKIFKIDIKTNFSASKRVAEYIETNLPEGSIFICPSNERATAIIPYLEKNKYKFYSPNAKRYYTYVSWDEAWRTDKTIDAMESAVQKMKSEGKSDIYILLPMHEYSCYTHILFLELEDRYERILEADDVNYEYCAIDEQYYLYKVKY